MVNPLSAIVQFTEHLFHVQLEIDLFC